LPGVRKCKLDGDAAFAAIAAGYWFLWVRCPACQMVSAIDLRGLDRARFPETVLRATLALGLKKNRRPEYAGPAHN